MLAENSKGELILIEVQNNNEHAYFQRMLFGVSKLVTEYINRGDSYGKVRKVYSVNIVYFSPGTGKDFVYHGKTEFRGIHGGDVIELTPPYNPLTAGRLGLFGGLSRALLLVDALEVLLPKHESVGKILLAHHLVIVQFFGRALE